MDKTKRCGQKNVQFPLADCSTSTLFLMNHCIVEGNPNSPEFFMIIIILICKGILSRGCMNDFLVVSLVITISFTNLEDLFMRVDMNCPSTAIVQVFHDVL